MNISLHFRYFLSRYQFLTDGWKLPLSETKSWSSYILYIDGLVQDRRNSSASAMELRLSCTNPSIYVWWMLYVKYALLLYAIDVVLTLSYWGAETSENISMAWCTTAVTPLLTHWSYYSIALSHRYITFAQADCVSPNFSSSKSPHKRSFT